MGRKSIFPKLWKEVLETKSKIDFTLETFFIALMHLISTSAARDLLEIRSNPIGQFVIYPCELCNHSRLFENQATCLNTC